MLVHRSRSLPTPPARAPVASASVRPHTALISISHPQSPTHTMSPRSGLSITMLCLLHATGFWEGVQHTSVMADHKNHPKCSYHDLHGLYPIRPPCRGDATHVDVRSVSCNGLSLPLLHSRSRCPIPHCTPPLSSSIGEFHRLDTCAVVTLTADLFATHLE